MDGGNVFTRAPQVGHFRVWRDGIGLSVFTDLYAISNHFSSTPNARVGPADRAGRLQRGDRRGARGGRRRCAGDHGGDFNVFPRPDDPFAAAGDADSVPSDQLGPMYEAGLHNLWDTLVAEVPRQRVQLHFEGQAQTLDHACASTASSPTWCRSGRPT